MGIFIIPYTIGHYLASHALPKVAVDHDAFKASADGAQKQIDRLLSIRGPRSVREIHRALGRVLWDDVGMSRSEASLTRALKDIPALREEFWSSVSVPGTPNNLNQNLEYAGRVADYLEFAELLALDALHRRESCGGHFREGEPDVRERSTARRCELLLRRGLGIHRRRSRAATAQRAAGVSRSPSEPAKLQVEHVST